MLVKSTDGVYRAAAFEEIGWLIHGFGTRAAPQTSLPGLATLRQIHSGRVLAVNSGRGCVGEGGALCTNTPGALLGVKTADCLPLLLADPNRRAVAAVHAGWRGTIHRVAARAVETLQERFGSVPAELRAAMGPCIGGCCFEVGPEVAAEFRNLFPERSDLNRKTRIDLVEANRRILIGAGLIPAAIHAWDAQESCCTVCTPGFHSWRRDREAAGRMVSVIGIRAGTTA